MTVIKKISSKAIISKVYRDLELKEESRWMDMIEWIGEAVEFIGAFAELENKVVSIPVEDYRGKVPCDLYQVIQTNYYNRPLQYATSTMHSYYHVDNCVDLRTENAETYSITSGGKYFNTSFREGSFLLSYVAIPTDEDGFPMIPDHAYFKEALMFYIVMKLEFPKWVGGRPSRYPELKQLWDEYCGKAGTHSIMPKTLDEMERIKDSIIRLIPQIDIHQGFFTDLSNPDDIIRN